MVAAAVLLLPASSSGAAAAAAVIMTFDPLCSPIINRPDTWSRVRYIGFTSETPLLGVLKSHVPVVATAPVASVYAL